MERENLAGDAKGKGASGYNREVESTNASVRGGLPRSSDEGPSMGLERRGWVIAVDLGQRVCTEEPALQRKAAAFARWHEPDESRGSSPDLRVARGGIPRTDSALAPQFHEATVTVQR